MRITFVLPYAGMAGGIRVIAIYAQRLKQRGHQVLVVSTPWNEWGLRAKARGILQQVKQKIRPGWEPMRDPSHFDGLDVEHIRITETRPVVDADVPEADVVVATWWETAPWVANLSASKGAKAYFVQDYGAHEGQPMELVAQTWRLPLHKIVISKWLMRLIDEHSDDKHAEYVPNAVDLQQFQALPRGKQSRPTVGFLYTGAPQKGCDTILQAITQAKLTLPQLHVVAYGPGDPSPKMPMPANAEFWKFAPDEKLKDIYGKCDAWLFGSRSEGFGLPILEAMACRTPVIATPAGAAPELLADGGGVLVKPNDSVDMAAAIVRMMNLPEQQWKTMSDIAHATANRYTWEDATDLFEAALRNSIARSAHNALTVA